MLESFHPPQSLVVWRRSLVFPHQFTGTGGLQAWYLSVQVLTTSLGGRAVHSHHAHRDPAFLRRLPKAAASSGDVHGHSPAQLGPGGPTVAEGGRALRGTQPGALQPLMVGCGSSSIPAFLLLPSAMRAFCAAEKSGTGGGPPSSPSRLPCAPPHVMPGVHKTLPGLRPAQLCLDVDRRPLGLRAVSGAKQLTPCF